MRTCNACPRVSRMHRTPPPVEFAHVTRIIVQSDRDVQPRTASACSLQQFSGRILQSCLTRGLRDVRAVDDNGSTFQLHEAVLQVELNPKPMCKVSMGMQHPPRLTRAANQITAVAPSLKGQVSTARPCVPSIQSSYASDRYTPSPPSSGHKVHSLRRDACGCDDADVSATLLWCVCPSLQLNKPIISDPKARSAPSASRESLQRQRTNQIYSSAVDGAPPQPSGP